MRSLGTIPNRGDAVERLLKKLGKPGELRVCYEAGPTGYALYWQLTSMGIACEVIAPLLAPTKPGDRVKTDPRDAERSARSYQSGDLTVVWVPDAKHEALRDLVRARGGAKEDSKRAKHRLGKYLLRYAQRPASGSRAWTAPWWQWLRKLELPHPEQNTTLLELILEQRGIVFTSAPHLIHRHADGVEEWMAFFDDLEGRTLAVMCQVSPDDG